ncbi:MAG: hypothetical protein IPM37_12515 [Hahellaceae bacterium]|jgi:hypothetical protein|nr:hypothetical protein [Hahellaceae bacterium]
MREHVSGHDYRREGDYWLVEMQVSQVEELFNNLDPLPFGERDLDANAAAYILDSVQELPDKSPIRIRIYLSSPPDAALQSLVSTTVSRYFSYRARVNRQRLANQFRKGRISLLVGLLFLSACLGLSNLFETLEFTGSGVLREGLLIVGWVAMWRPLEIFLYDWWPPLGRAHLYERLARLPVELCGPPSERKFPTTPT